MARLLFLSTFFFMHLYAFDKVIIWGHKLHTHTHSYIHNGFYRAFKELGYETFWFDDLDDVSSFDFSNSLFLTEGQVDHKIPLRQDCVYIAHNPSSTKYATLKTLYLLVYTDDILSYPAYQKIENGIYYDRSAPAIVIPWATDLLPKEIEEMEEKLGTFPKTKEVWWIGTLGLTDHQFSNFSEIDPFRKAAEESGIQFIHSCPWGRPMSVEDHIQKIASSFMAPAIVGKWQKKQGYIPCRIFKNISYGNMGITNSYRTWELFEKKIVYNPDTYQLFYDAIEAMKTYTLEDQKEMMEFVKNKHTYINRTETLLECLRDRNWDR